MVMQKRIRWLQGHERGSGVPSERLADARQHVGVDQLQTLQRLDHALDAGGEAKEVDAEVDVEECMVQCGGVVVIKHHAPDLPRNPAVEVKGEQRAELGDAALRVCGLHVESFLEAGVDLAAGVAWVAHEVLQAERPNRAAEAIEHGCRGMVPRSFPCGGGEVVVLTIHAAQLRAGAVAVGDVVGKVRGPARLACALAAPDLSLHGGSEGVWVARGRLRVRLQSASVRCEWNRVNFADEDKVHDDIG